MHKWFKVMLERGSYWLVPWDFVAPHEERAIKNHSQTLETLHSRGGLAPSELIDVLEDLAWRGTRTVEEDITKIMELLKEWYISEWQAENLP